VSLEPLESNKQLVERLYAEVINGGDAEAAQGLVSSDFVQHRVFVGQSDDEQRGAAALLATLAPLRAAFPDMAFALEDMIAENDRVAVRWTMTATHQGTFAGIEPTHRRISQNGFVIYRVTNECITDSWALVDVYGLMVQIGGIAPPTQPESAA